MKDYIEERAVEIAYYIIEHKATVRQTAKAFGVSKSTIHKDVTELGFRFFFTPRQGYFSPFLHSTSSLSVTE